MKRRSNKVLLLIILLANGCGSGNQGQNVSLSEVPCLEDLRFHSMDSLFVPDFVRMRILHYDTSAMGTIHSIVLPGIEERDSLFYGYELWNAIPTSKDTTVLTVNLHYRMDADIPKDSIAQIASKQVGVVTSRGDTIYVEPCR